MLEAHAADRLMGAHLVLGEAGIACACRDSVHGQGHLLKSREGSQLSGPGGGVDAKVGVNAIRNHPGGARRLARVNEVAVGAAALQKLHAPSISVCSVGVVVAHVVIKDFIRGLRVSAHNEEVLATVVGDGDLAGPCATDIVSAG
jgi:hypothetical protein